MLLSTCSCLWQEEEEEEENTPGVLDMVEADDGTDPTAVPPPSAAELIENAERFSADMSARMKDKGDLFDEMVVHEEQIRLGDEGWKARYYQVGRCCLDDEYYVWMVCHAGRQECG